MFAIYEVGADGKDEDRYVEGFDTREDAEYVLKALRRVNIFFNRYKIKELTK